MLSNNEDYLPFINSRTDFFILCANFEGYDGEQMKKALSTMNKNNYNTRVYQATDGQYYPHL